MEIYSSKNLSLKNHCQYTNYVTPEIVMLKGDEFVKSATVPIPVVNFKPYTIKRSKHYNFIKYVPQSIKGKDNYNSDNRINACHVIIPIKSSATKKETDDIYDNSYSQLKDTDFIVRLFIQELEEHEKEFLTITKKLFGDFGEISTRIKSKKSIISKLAKKPSEKSLQEAIADAYGTRIKLNPIDNQITKSFVEDCGYNYDEFNQELQKCIDEKRIPSENYISLIEKLKIKQTQPIVNKLIEQSHNKNFQITEINNYGDEISSYFTYDQVKEIASAIGNPNLRIVTKLPKKGNINTHISLDEKKEKDLTTLKIKNKDIQTTVKVTDKGAVKDSGYATSQMNIKYLFSDYKTGFGELQIRSTLLDKFADAEHIPYDIRKGKITEDDKKYLPIYNLINGMDQLSYDKYNQYLNKVYQSIRLQELGFDIKIPELKGEFKYKNGKIIKENELDKLSYKSLIDFHEKQ